MTLGEYLTQDNPKPSSKSSKPFKPLDDPSAFMSEEEFECEMDRQEFGRQYIHKYKEHARKYYGQTSDEIVTDNPRYQEALSLYNTEYEASRVIRNVERQAGPHSGWNYDHKHEDSNTTRTVGGDYKQQDTFIKNDGSFYHKQSNLPIPSGQQYHLARGGDPTSNVSSQVQSSQQWPVHNLSHATHSGYNPHYQTGFPSHEFLSQRAASNEFQGPYFGSLALSKLPPAPTEPQAKQIDVKRVPGHGDMSSFKFPAAKGDTRSLYNNGHPPECKCDDCEPWRLIPTDVSQMPPTIGASDGKKIEAGKVSWLSRRGVPREYTGSSHFKKFQADFAVAFDRYIQKHGHKRRTSMEIFDEIAKDPIFKNYPGETSDSLGNTGTPYRLPVGYGRYKYQERGRLFGLFNESEDVPSNWPSGSQDSNIMDKQGSTEFPKLNRQILPGRDNNQLLNAVEQYKYEMEPKSNTSEEEKVGQSKHM